MFKDRTQVGKLLAKKVADELKSSPLSTGSQRLVVGLPRGGVPVAKEVALHIGAPLTILVSKKVGAPGNPELAIGAVSSEGVVVLNRNLTSHLDGHGSYLEDQILNLTQETKLLQQRWLTAAGVAEQLSFAGKQVIIVDDGVATGMTTEAALKSARKMGAAQVILAIPVIAHNTITILECECDLLITLMAPHDFWAVGQFYEDFHQISDNEVIEALQDVNFLTSQTTA